MEKLRETYADEIYRPGEDVSHLENLTLSQKSERRVEIEDVFAHPEAYAVEE